MDYCLVQNGAIIEGPRSLPKTTANVSNLHLLDDAALKALGWLPFSEVHNATANQVMTSSEMVVSEDAVTRTFVYRDMTAEELAATQQVDNTGAWSNTRSERNNRLSRCDWTQLADSPLTDAEKLNWKTYRQALRDITTQTDPNNITWPLEPGQGIGVAVL
jgi:hypothetical protein